MTHHIDQAMYGSLEVREKLLKDQQQKHQEYCDMVYAALSNPQGDMLISSMKEYLTKPVYHAGDDDKIIMLREGARMYVRDLLGAYETGKGK